MIQNTRCDIPFERDVNDDLWEKYMTKAKEIRASDGEKTTVEVYLGYGGESYENDTFMVRSYDWSDAEEDEDKNDFHFLHKPSGFRLAWYKYPLRGAVCNKDISSNQFLQILRDCYNSYNKDHGINVFYGGIERWWEDRVPVSEDDRAEFVGQIIDIFEDFLEEKGVNIPNPEKEEAADDGGDPESPCIIYGTDYGDLADDLESLLRNWGILGSEDNAEESISSARAEDLSPAELGRAWRLYENIILKSEVEGCIEFLKEAAEDDDDEEMLEKLGSLDIEDLVSSVRGEKEQQALFDRETDPLILSVIEDHLQ